MSLHRTLLLAAAVSLGGALGAQAFTLHVLHFNDFHSRIEAIDRLDATCGAAGEAAGECFGGAARLHTAVHELRDRLTGQGENVIVLSAGDNFQGSLFFSAYSGQAELEFLNAIGLDAMMLGNHEFDIGLPPLAKFIEGAGFPVLFGNVDASGDDRMAALDKGPAILERNGERVAIVGAITADTAEISSPGPTLAFADPVTYLTRTVADLEAQGIDRIILLSHVGAVEDARIAAEVPGIDAIVGGHSHTLYANDDPEAAYPYPDLVPGAAGGTVPVVQAGAFSKYLGHLILEFDDRGDVVSATGGARLLDASVAPNPDILKRIETMAVPIEELKNRVIGQVGGDIDGSREACRFGECPMGNLVADAMLDRVKSQGVTIAIQNGGGLRASIGSGDVTMGDVLTVLPFQNTLSTFNLKGAGVIAALENGVSQVEEGGGRFPQVAGLQFTWDASVPPRQGRVKDVLVQESSGWVPIDPEKMYAVVSNNFMRGGGDGYAVFRDEGRNAYDYGPGLEEVLADYIERNPGYEPLTDGRITRVE